MPMGSIRRFLHGTQLGQYRFTFAVYADSVARSSFSGSAWQSLWRRVSAQTTVHNAYPAKDIYFTEVLMEHGTMAVFSADLIRNGNLSLMLSATGPRQLSNGILRWTSINGPKIAGGCDTCYGFCYD